MDCTGLCTSATSLLVRENNKLEELQLSGCINGVDNIVMGEIAQLTKTLSFLDISYCNLVTDEGLKHFADKTYPLISLVVNGLDNISSPALSAMIGSCTETLVELEAALMDQIEMKGDFFINLAKCGNLEYLDLTGTKNIDDMSFSHLGKYEI
jgi:hypothetical protein